MLTKYNEKELKNNKAANFGRPYQQCVISVMDTIADPDITFDENGISNYYYEYQRIAKEGLYSNEDGIAKMNEMVNTIKRDTAGQKYDCILGLSGGADSTYLAYLAKKNGLNPLLVHFDYGWNLETAVQNIEQIVKILKFDLFTYVMDWEQFKDLQRSYFKASVLDLDVPADHLIFAALSKVAKDHKIKYILKGYNITTEAILPKSWNYNRKFDLTNLKNIHKKFGEGEINKIPKLGVWQRLYYQQFAQIIDYSPLNYINYNKNEVKNILKSELNWVDYGGKHCENVFTRFYQGYILPVKFNIDKRKAHLSTLIFSGQITKEEAQLELSKPPYDENLIDNDFEYVAKKLGFTNKDFSELLKLPNVDHLKFGDESKTEQLIYRMFKVLKPVKPIIKWVLKK